MYQWHINSPVMDKLHAIRKKICPVITEFIYRTYINSLCAPLGELFSAYSWYSYRCQNKTNLTLEIEVWRGLVFLLTDSLFIGFITICNSYRLKLVCCTVVQFITMWTSKGPSSNQMPVLRWEIILVNFLLLQQEYSMQKP